MKKIKYIIIVCILYAACHRIEKQETKANYIIKGDTITIPDNSNLKSKINVESVMGESFQMQFITAGTVKAIPTQYAEIAPPFSGRVTKSYLKLGMKTSTETPLFEISSPDFIEAQKLFFQAKSEMQLAEKTLKRQEDLMTNGVGTQKDLEEAQTAYDVANKEYENAVVGIKIFKANPNHLSLGQALVVHSPIDGEVLENKVVLGQFIKDDATSIAVVAELSKIWIVGQVKEKDIRYIHKLDNCEIDIAALPEKHIKGKIFFIEEIVNEDTRSIQVLVEADNFDHTLKPGMYVTINFSELPIKAILISTKALLQMNDASFVFKETSTGKYLRQKVETDGTQNDSVVIRTGLKDGDRIITQGAYYIFDAK